MAVFLALFSRSEVDFPNGQIRIASLFQQRPSDVLTKDAALSGGGSGGVEIHSTLVQSEMFSNAMSEIPILPMGADSNNSRPLSAVTPILAILVEEVDSVIGKRSQIKRKTYNRQSLQLLVQRSTEL